MFCITGGAVSKMRKLVPLVLAAFVLLGISAAQNVPPINVFGGYSYYSLDLPGNTSTATTSNRLGMNGWDVSGSFFRWHRLSAEADVSGHTVSNCVSENYNCSNLSYMFGPRLTLRQDHKLNVFVHGLVGEDHATLAYNGSSLTDNSLAFAGGAGADYWVTRRIGIQLGSVDYVYTRHLNDFDVPTQSNFRASFGVAFRFGGEYSGGSTPKSRPSSSTSASSQPAATVAVRQPAQSSLNPSSRGMAIASLGIVVGPQEFDGAKIIEVDPAGIGEMASMKAGDLIKTVDGKPIRTPMELLAELQDKTGKVKIGIQRGEFSTETLVLIGAH
jgi:hypothetical protein